MIFHVRPRKSKSFAPTGHPAESAARPPARLSPGRVGLAFLLVIGLAVAAFVAQDRDWAEAATVFLHLTEVTAAAIIGLLLGERSAVREG